MIITSKNMQYVVDMFAQTCNCLKFQKRRIFCRHVIAMCRAFNLKSKSYISDLYNCEIYKKIYAMHLNFIILEDLTKFETCFVFSKQIKIDRFKQKKLRRKRIDIIARKCDYCRRSNHNTTICDQKSQSEMNSVSNNEVFVEIFNDEISECSIVSNDVRDMYYIFSLKLSVINTSQKNSSLLTR